MFDAIKPALLIVAIAAAMMLPIILRGGDR